MLATLKELVKVSSVSLHVGIMNSFLVRYAYDKGFQRVSARRNYELISDKSVNLSGVSSVSLHVGIMN